MNFRPALFAFFASLVLAANASAQNIPKGYVVPKCSISPDGRYGVTVPISSEDEERTDVQNSVIELKTGRIVTAIKTRWTAFTRMGHGGVVPCRWSPDSSILVWEVSGKWFPDALVVLKFGNGELLWQCDLTQAAQREILNRTKQAAPEKYARAKKENAGSGEAYPEGFSIYVQALDPVSFPLRVGAALTSDPKGIESRSRLESSLKGSVDDGGKFSVKEFRVAPRSWQKFLESIEPPNECEFGDETSE